MNQIVNRLMNHRINQIVRIYQNVIQMNRVKKKKNKNMIQTIMIVNRILEKMKKLSRCKYQQKKGPMKY